MFTREQTGATRKITVLVVGSERCGKTSLCTAIHGLDPKQDTHDLPVLGVQMRSSNHRWNNVDVELTTWDLSLDDIQLLSITNTVFDYVALCFRADKRRTLQDVKRVLPELQNAISNANYILVGCRSDDLQYLMLSEATDYITTGAQTAKKLKLPLVFTSATKKFCVTELREAWLSSFIDKKKFKTTLQNFIASKLH